MGKRHEHPLDGEDVRYSLRLPPDLYAALAQWGDDDGRSLHAQMLWVLNDGVRRRRRAVSRGQPRREAS